MYKVVARVNDIGRVGTVGGGRGQKGVFPRLKCAFRLVQFLYGNFDGLTNGSVLCKL